MVCFGVLVFARDWLYRLHGRFYPNITVGVRAREGYFQRSVSSIADTFASSRG